ncbi:MAG: M48 family metalloprotease [Phycisphaerales bacterium]|nr:M48 family metalloprotease [Phycisphaerales bacterium]
MPQPVYRRRPGAGAGCLSRGGGRLLIAAAIALIAIISFYSSRSQNPVTGKMQHVDLTPDQEIALGLQSAPEMAQQFGGLAADPQAQEAVDTIGRRLVSSGPAADSPYRFEFHLLADPKTVNAFALPGGQVFITVGLLDRLETEGQLAGVLAHEIGHVIERHGAEHLAKQRLTTGLVGAVGVAASDPDRPSSGAQAAAIAAAIGQLINMRYGRDDELESDGWGVRLAAAAGYDPRSMIRVMEILAEASQGQAPPEFFSTHPNPENRIARIEAAIAEVFPSGVPDGLEP